MEDEIRMIEKNQTWELVDRPKNREVVGVKWIYKTKLNQDGNIQKHKARLVARGFTQKPATRPDIMFAASLLSRYMQSPTQNHMGAAKRVLRYLQGTLDYGILYQPVKDSKLVGFSDSDWAGCLDDMRSTSSYVFSLGSGICSWSSKKQKTVAQSSAEAEYVAAAKATSQAIWLRRILEDIGEKQEDPTVLYCDNKSAIAMGKNPISHDRTKHIAIKFHFIREAVEQGEIQLMYCRTQDQMADVLTKAVTRDKFIYLRELIGVTKKVH
ncbi:hypothetical protein LWI29_016765 [Acer saccharum]|uniref:Reverse transcriptase Ty1/copia-type domain-containing protein n=1 Tax=Acer saccharum TaxID=4024 RepID=A0AA39SSS9_ACESA|nr:hypothetical protein LWI29_016765 [Acer saccharum]